MFPVPATQVVDLAGPQGHFDHRDSLDKTIRIGVLDGSVGDGDWAAMQNYCDLVYVRSGADADRRCAIAVPDVHAAAEALCSHIEDNPQASAILASVLRASDSMSVRAGLDVESWAYSTLLGGVEFSMWLGGRGDRDLPGVVDDGVLVERDDDTLVIVLNRPERRNAYGAALRDSLCAALDVAIIDDSIRSVEIRASGPVFCAGGDLAEFGTTPDPVTAHFVRTAAGAAVRLAQVADRSDVFLHSACVGAGIEIPAFACRITADPGAYFRLPEVSMGLIPGAGGTVSIPRRIGRWRTFHMAVSGDIIDAATALQWGLVDEIRPVTPYVRQ